MKFFAVLAAVAAVALPANAFTVVMQNKCSTIARILHVNTQSGYSKRNPIAAGKSATYNFEGPLTRGSHNTILIGRGNKVPASENDSSLPQFYYEFQDPRMVQFMIYAGGANQTTEPYYNDAVTMMDSYTHKTYTCPKKSLCCSAFCPFYPDPTPVQSDVDATVKVVLCAQ